MEDTADPILMPCRAPFLLGAGLCLVFGMRAHGQEPPRPAPMSDQRAISLFEQLESQEQEVSREADRRLDSLLDWSIRSQDSCRMARIHSWRAHSHLVRGILDSSMIELDKAKRAFQGACDSLHYMSIQGNLSATLLELGEFEAVVDVTQGSLALWNEDWPKATSRNGLLTNRAIAKAYMGDMDGALAGFKDVRENARREGMPHDELDALGNLGALFGMMSGDGEDTRMLDSALFYQRQALEVSKQLDDRGNLTIQYSNLAVTAENLKDYPLALSYLDSSLAIAVADGLLPQQLTLADHYGNVYLKMGEPDSTIKYMKHHEVLKDSLLNIEKVRAIADVQEKYESEKKARTIKELQVKQLDSELTRERLQRTRNLYLFSGVGILFMALGLWSRLRFVHRSRAAIQAEKEVSEALLHNILPEEVADEMRAKGYADAREFEQATILFTDFKGFTAMAEVLSAGDLVKEIDHCFKAFDAIIDRHGIEKIKTIGDAYMAAGGLPDPANGRPGDVVEAALELQEYMEEYKKQREAAGLPHFEMRLGMHTGPVVAGIVGVKKYAYDIWGDTVNTASRMESSGAVGRVNISGDTYALVRDDPRFSFTHRGRVQAKGKGEMDMYFVDRA